MTYSDKLTAALRRIRPALTVEVDDRTVYLSLPGGGSVSTPLPHTDRRRPVTHDDARKLLTSVEHYLVLAMDNYTDAYRPKAQALLAAIRGL